MGLRLRDYQTRSLAALEAYFDEATTLGAKRAFVNRLMSLTHGKGRDFRSIATQRFGSFAEDIDWMMGCLRAAGVDEIVMVDLTKPAFDIPVVRLVIPGLEGPDDHTDYCKGHRALAQMREAR